MLLSDFFSTVYLPRRLRGRSENSIRLYRLCIRQFSRTLGRPATVADLTEANVLAHLQRRKSVAAATRNKELAELTAMWRLATQRGLLATWPDIPDEPEPQRTPIAWMPEELRRLLHAAANQPGKIGDVDAGLFWEGLIRLILDTGERVSAAASVRWSWLQDDWLRVPAEARKAKTRDRLYRLSTTTIGVLHSIRQQNPSTDELFAWPYSPGYLWARFKRVVAAADLPTTRAHQFHAIRKTCASAVYAAGLDPQDALDHSDRRTTQRYLDPRFRRERHAADVLADFLRSPGRRDQEPPIDERDAG